MNWLARDGRNPTIDRLQQEASEAWENLEYQKGFHLLERAARKEPANPSHQLNLAQAHAARYDFAAAEHFFEKALKLSRNRTQTLEKAGQICLGLEYVEMAFQYFKRAGKKPEVSAGALLNLVDMSIRDRQLDEAAGFLGRADHKDSRVLFQEAALRRAQGRPEEAETHHPHLRMPGRFQRESARYFFDPDIRMKKISRAFYIAWLVSTEIGCFAEFFWVSPADSI